MTDTSHPEFYGILTNAGELLQFDCLDIPNKTFEMFEMAVGDGNGSYYEPEKTQTKLKNECYRHAITRRMTDEENRVKSVILDIPEDVTGFTIREVGVFGANGELLIIAKYPETPKLDTSSGAISQLAIKVDLSQVNELILPILIDPSVNTASVEYVEKYFQKLEEKGQSMGYASLDADGLVPIEQLPVEEIQENSANLDLTNLSPSGEKHFINKTQVTNCILEAPNGVCTYSGNTITVKSGLKVLAPNGRNADGSLKNYEYTLASDSSKELSSAGTGLSVFFLRSLDNGQTWDIGYRSYGTQWYIQEEQPQVEHCEWYNPKTNLWKHCVSGEWSDILICPLGRVSCNEGQIISLYNYETTDLLKRSDRGEIIGWDRPNLTISGSQLKGYNTVYTAEEDGWVQFNTHVQCTVNYLSPTSYIQVYGIIDEINVFGHMLRCNWDGGVNTVGTATMQSLITRIYRGQTYKLYTYQATGSASVVSYELRFNPLAKKGA